MDLTQKLQLDAKHQEFRKTTLASCNYDFSKYYDKHEALQNELLSMGMPLPDEWKESFWRLGLPALIREDAAAWEPSPGVNRLSAHGKVERSLHLAQKLIAVFLASHSPDSSLDSSSNPTLAATPVSPADLALQEPAPPARLLAKSRSQNADRELPPSSPPADTKRRAEEDAETDELPLQTKRVRVANANRNVTKRTNAKKLLQQNDPTEPSVRMDKVNLYYLGPCTTVYNVFPYLVNFATDVEVMAPLAMNVATLPKAQSMMQIISDTVRNYARSRTSHSLTNVPTDGSHDAIEVVNLDEDMLKEPREITRAQKFQDSLVLISKLWKSSASLVVRKRILESWATTILHNAVGLKVGDDISRTAQSGMKKATLKLMPVLRPSQLHGESHQNLLRIRYYWALLSHFRTNAAAFIVAYRPTSVDSIILSDSAARLKGDDIVAWIPIIKLVEQHVTSWFDALEGSTGRPVLKAIRKSLYTPSSWASPNDKVLWNSLCANPTPHSTLLSPETALNIATYGHDGFLSRRKLWSVMETVSRESIAISDIPEASFLGIVPGRLRCGSMFYPVGCIPGPDGIWLDTRKSTGPLSKIALGSPDEVNTVLAWHIAGDSRTPLKETAWVLAFSSRPIKVFQQLVSWKGNVWSGRQDEA